MSIFFNQSSVNGHLGCFHILTIVNNTAMNVGVHFRSVDFFGYMPKNGIAGSYDSSIFSFFEKPPYYFSTAAIPIYTTTNSVQGFPFLHILANVCYFCYF